MKTKRLTAREKVTRDDAIVTAKMSGRCWRSIAREFELSERQCQSILAEYRNSNPSLRHRDPIDVLDEMLERYEGAQDALASIASSTAHPATKVGAIRSSLTALGMQTDLLIAVGVLPRDLGELAVQQDTRRTVKAILDVLDRHQVGPSVERDILAAIDRRDADAIRSSRPRDHGQITTQPPGRSKALTEGEGHPVD